MSLISFVKEAGEKLFGRGTAQAAMKESAAAPMLSVDQSAPEAKYYTVVSGDNLSKISKTQYGDANKYMVIFEANRPMLQHPDKIYPGQVLRIPPL